MKSCSKVTAIIPARGGSKGVPRKNIRLLAGKPLIAYTIEAGLQCSRVDNVIVSTEDSTIKKISLEWGAEVIDRPRELASDASLTSEVLSHVLETLEQNHELPDCFALLQPTSPLRNASHLQSCLDLFFESKADCVVSVTEAEHHPYKSFRLASGYLRPLFDASYLDKPRQTMPTIYRQNGAIYVLKTDVFLSKKVLFVEPTLPFIMSREASIDIDTELDFLIAELILSRENLKNSRS